MKKLRKLQEKIKTIWKAKIAGHLTHAANSTNIALIFLLEMGHALSGIAQYFVFPVAIGANAIEAVLSIHHAYKHGKKDTSAIVNAVATTATALGIIAALILTFVGGAALGVVAPAILTGVLGLKALYDLGAGCYYWYKYAKCRKTDPAKAKEYFKKARHHTINFVVDALITTATGLVLIGDEFSFGALAVVGGTIGAGCASYAAYKGYKQYKAKLKKQMAEELEKQIPEENVRDDVDLTNNAFLHQTFGLSPSASATGNTHAPFNHTDPVVIDIPMNQPENQHTYNAPSPRRDARFSRR